MAKKKSAIKIIEKYLGNCEDCKVKLKLSAVKIKGKVGLGAKCPKCGTKFYVA